MWRNAAWLSTSWWWLPCPQETASPETASPYPRLQRSYTPGTHVQSLSDLAEVIYSLAVSCNKWLLLLQLPYRPSYWLAAFAAVSLNTAKRRLEPFLSCCHFWGHCQWAQKSTNTANPIPVWFPFWLLLWRYKKFPILLLAPFAGIYSSTVWFAHDETHLCYVQGRVGLWRCDTLPVRCCWSEAGN